VKTKNTLSVRLKKKLGVKAPLIIDNKKSLIRWLMTYIAEKQLKAIRLKHELRKTRRDILKAKIAILALKIGIIK